MTSSFAAIVLPQLDELIGKYELLRARSKYDDCSDVDKDQASELVTATMAAIHRIGGPNNPYGVPLEQAMQQYKSWQVSSLIPHAAGALKALRHAVASGYLVSLQELIHANLFSDFLDMAEHLLDEGYKDASAVMIGSVLEEHLRKLCERHGIAVETTDSKGVVRPKKADAMNAEMAAAIVYSKLDQKNVTAWLDLRNKAAHGFYSEYN